MSDIEYQHGKIITFIANLENVDNFVYEGNPKGLSCELNSYGENYIALLKVT